MNRAKYSAGLDDQGTPPVIWVVDEQEDGAASVTNDAERVVAEVVKLYGDLIIIYQDSDGLWDQLRHKSGVFESFGHVGGRDRHSAAWLVRQLAKDGLA